MSNWYSIKNIEKIESPSLILYPKRIKENISKLIEIAGSSAFLRPHVKTNKIPEVCSLMMDAGIDKFKCATIAEAEMLGLIGAPDILLAYQPVGPNIERLLNLVNTFPKSKFSCLIDNIETAYLISDQFKTNEIPLSVFIDINVGMNRTGIIPEKVLGLFEGSQKIKGIKIIGLHIYDGHIEDTDLVERGRRADAFYVKVEELIHLISNNYSENLLVVVGGSPTFPIHIKRKGAQCSPGTFVFWDWGYNQLIPDEPFVYAALVITRIVSIVDSQTICTDLGYKSVASENPLPRIHFLNAPDAEPIAHSEEHLVVKLTDTSKWKIGDVLYGVPIHICPTVALYDWAIIVDEANVIDKWKVTARLKKINI